MNLFIFLCFIIKIFSQNQYCQGYYLNDGQCKTCGTSCTKCRDDFIFECIECVDGYYLSSGECKECPQDNCIACSYSGEDECTNCDVGYYLLDGKCIYLPDNCAKVDEDGECKECLDTYYFSGGECVKCGEADDTHCLTCGSDGVCTSCEKHYIVVSKVCQYDSSKYCYNNVQNCVECESQTECSVCEDGYVVNDEGLCENCNSIGDGKCEVCYNSSICTKCIKPDPISESGEPTGYFLNKTDQQCYSCQENCRKCKNKETCSECIIKYYFNEATSKCEPCMENCLYCSDGNSCEECYNIEEDTGLEYYFRSQCFFDAGPDPDDEDDDVDDDEDDEKDDDDDSEGMGFIQTSLNSFVLVLLVLLCIQ